MAVAAEEGFLIFRGTSWGARGGSPSLPGTRVLPGGHTIVKAEKIPAGRELRALLWKQAAKWIGLCVNFIPK